MCQKKLKIFQSTLSVRRATVKNGRYLQLIEISIHALREESDLLSVFLLPVLILISIHALREESDPGGFAVNDVQHVYFNPRSP